MSSTGVIEDAVVKILAKRYRLIRLEQEFPKMWTVDFVLSDEIGYHFTVTDEVFQRYQNMGFTYETIVESLVTFIFSLVEKDMGSDEDEIDDRLLN